MKKTLVFKFQKGFAVLLSFIFAFSSMSLPVRANTQTPNAVLSNQPAVHPKVSSGNNSIIVKYKNEKKSSVVKESISKKLNQYQIRVKKKIENIEIIDTADNAEFEMVLHALKNNPDIEYAQPDYKLRKLDTPKEDLSATQWGLSNTGQAIMGQNGTVGVDINISPVWDYEKGKDSVIVGILDTGIDINHPELKDSIYVNHGEISGNNIDDDNNGYIDDINGWDFMNSDSTVFDNTEEDAHATHVAGIIAAKHNAEGINGIAPGVKILPLKFLNNYDGFTSDAIEAIRYAKSIGVKVMNCSFGDVHYNYALEKEMRDSGILFVCGSGNDGENMDTTPFYPASFDIPNKITVAAINNQGQLSSFSNYGKTVDVAAPGENIISTIPGGKYEYYSGTSMAAPFVTGTAALSWSNNPSFSLSKVKEKIHSSIKKLDSLTGKVETGGIVNVFKASLSRIIPYDNSVLTRTTDKIHVNHFASGSIDSYSFNDMVPLVDGWVIIGDIVKNKVLILNVLSGEVAKEYQLNSSPERIDFNPEKGKIIVTQRSSNHIALIDLYTDKIKYIPISGDSLDVVFAKDNYAVATISNGSAWWENIVSVLDWESGLEVTSFSGHSEDYRYLVCDRNTNNIFVCESGSSANSLVRLVFNENTKTLENKGYLMDTGGGYDNLAISPDGRHATFGVSYEYEKGYSIIDFDATNINNQLGKWNLYASPTSVAFSRDSQYIIIASENSIKLFDAATHELVETIVDHTPLVRKVGISNSGRMAFAKGEDRKLYYYLIKLPSMATEPPTEIPTETLTPMPTPTEIQTSIPSVLTPQVSPNANMPELTSMTDNIDVNQILSGSINGYSFNDMIPVANGWVIIGDVEKNRVFIINVLTGEVKKEYQLSAPPDRIDFNPEKGKIIVTQRLSNNIALINPYTDEIKYISISGIALDVVFAKDNYAVAILSIGDEWWEKKISVLDWESGLEITSISAQSVNYNYLACDRNTNNILAGVSGLSPSSLTRLVFNENTKVLEQKDYVWNMGSFGQDLAISPDGRHAAFVCASGNDNNNMYAVFDIDPTNINNKYGDWNTGDYPSAVAFSKDSKYIIISNGSSIKLFDVTTHVLVETIADNGYSSGFNKVGISNGGKIAFVKGDNGKLYYYFIRLFSPPTPTSAPTPIPLNNSIKGKVYLPGNLTADEDIHIEVYLQSEKVKLYTTNVVIKKGNTSQDYTLLSPSTSSQDKFQIGYRICEGGTSYAQSGCYASAGTTFDEDLAENIKIENNIEGLNIDLLMKRKISGRVSLPYGKSAPAGGIEVKVVAGNKYYPYYTEYITIPEGQSSADYELTALTNNSEYKYFVGYELKDVPNYLSSGYYKSPATTYVFENADSIDISKGDASGINMTLQSARNISGFVSLPNNRVAPTDGIQVQVVVQPEEGDTNHTALVKIEEGKNSAIYTISVPDINESYYVSYYTISNGFVREGYYCGGTTTAESSDAVKVNVYNQTTSGINLTLIPGGTVKGRISLPYGSAPNGGIKLEVFAINSDVIMVTNVLIKEGSNYADYTLTIPDGSYRIGYYAEQKGFVKLGYSYNTYSTTAYGNNAYKYDVRQSIEQYINLELMYGTDITGEIRLSSGQASTGGMDVNVFVITPDGNSMVESVLIPAGSYKTNYTITVPKNQNYYLGYELRDDSAYYYSAGLYSDTQTVYEIEFATPVYIGSNTISNKNLTILTKVPVPNTPTPTLGTVLPPFPPFVLPAGSPIATATPTMAPVATATPTVAPTPTPTPDTKTNEPVTEIPAVGSYKDISGHWAQDQIRTLLEKGIISGYEDNTIRPNQEISRVEAVVIICKAMGLKPAQDIKLGFKDGEDIPKWARGYVQAAVDNGITKGYADNTFKPNMKVTRAEVVALVMNAFKFQKAAKAIHVFKDSNKIEPWARAFIQNAYEIGIITGYKDNTIRPKNNIKRAEMFVITSKCLNVKK